VKHLSEIEKTPKTDHDKLVDFDVIKENWHAYELEDGSIIRTKNVLLSIVDVGPVDEKESAAVGARKGYFALKFLAVIHSPEHLRGPKDKAWEAPELEGYIVEKNLKFRQIKDGGNCEYSTKKTKITVQTYVRQIDKTSKFDLNGMPAYLIRTEANILIATEAEKRLEETKPRLAEK
jgi:hypothetical protein